MHVLLLKQVHVASYIIMRYSTELVHVGYHAPPMHVFTGGCDKDGKPISVAEVYSVSERSWKPLPPLPRNRAACTKAVVRENKIYLVGGVTDKQVPIPQVDCFDIATQTWGQVQPLPHGVVGPFVALIDDKLYSFAGTDKKGCNQSVVYDFDKGDWLSLPDKPTPCYSCGGYVFERKVYIVGGREGKIPVSAVEMFDLDTHQWEELSALGSVRVFYNIVGIKDEIYVIGGLVPMVGVCKIVERYSIYDNSWSRLKDLGEIRSDGGAGVVGNRVVVVGGLGGANLRGMNTGVAIKYQGKKFRELPPLEKERSSLTSLSFEGKLAVLNGVGEGGVQSMVEVLSVKK